MFSQNSIKWENSADINTRFDITTKLRVLWNICLVMPHCSEENSAALFWNYHNLDNNKKKNTLILYKVKTCLVKIMLIWKVKNFRKLCGKVLYESSMFSVCI